MLCRFKERTIISFIYFLHLEVLVSVFKNKRSVKIRAFSKNSKVFNCRGPSYQRIVTHLIFLDKTTLSHINKVEPHVAYLDLCMYIRSE